jgi:hypothetical protein
MAGTIGSTGARSKPPIRSSASTTWRCFSSSWRS